jgi:hypothetical protein
MVLMAAAGLAAQVNLELDEEGVTLKRCLQLHLGEDDRGNSEDDA